jgi:hypothetical protein
MSPFELYMQYGRWADFAFVMTFTATLAVIGYTVDNYTAKKKLQAEKKLRGATRCAV